MAKHYLVFIHGMGERRPEDNPMEGEPFTQLINPVRGAGRSWSNFWDSEDPIAYPLEQLFQRNPDNADAKLTDIPVETGFLVFDSHGRYWSNKGVAQTVANTIAQP